MACSKDLVNLSKALDCASNFADMARNLSSIVGDLSDIVASCVGDNSGVGGESFRHTCFMTFLMFWFSINRTLLDLYLICSFVGDISSSVCR